MPFDLNAELEDLLRARRTRQAPGQLPTSDPPTAVQSAAVPPEATPGTPPRAPLSPLRQAATVGFDLNRSLDEMGLPQASGPRLPPVEPESAGVGDLVSDIGVGLAKIPLVLGEDVARIARGAGAFDPATGFDPQAGAQPKGFASKAVNWLRRRSEATRLPPEEAKRGYFGTGFLRESVREGLGQAGHSLPGMAAAAGVTLAAAARGAAAGKKVAGTRGAVVGAVGGALGASLKAGAVQAAANSPMFFAVRDSRVEQLFEDRKAKNPGLTREQWAAEWPAIIANADTYARHEIESEIAQDLVHGALAKWAGAAGGIGRVLARVAASAPANAVTEVLGEAWTERSQSKRDVEMRLADGVKSWGQSIADVWQQSAAMSLFMSGLGAGWQFAANRNYRKFKGEAMPELQRMGLPAEVVEEFNKAGTPEAWGAARKKHAETIAAAAGEAGARAAEAQATRTTEDGTRKTEVPAGPVGGAVDPAAVEAQRVAREAVVAGPGTPQAAAVDQTFEAVMKAKIEGTPEAPQDAGLARWPRIENMVRARRAAGLPELPEETMDSLTAGEMGLLRPASDADLAALAGAAAGAPVARTEDGIRNTEVAAPAMAEGQSPTVGGGPGVVATAPAEPAPATADGQSPTPAGVDAAGVVEVPGETVDGILVRALGAGEGQPHAAAWEAMIDQGATDDEILKQAAVSFHLGGSKRGGAATWSYGAKKNKPSFKAQAQGEVSMLAGSYLAERIRAVLGIPQKVAPQAPERVLDTTPPAEPRVHKPVPKFSLVSINAWLDRVEKNGVASFRATDLRKTAERATDTAVRLEAFPHIPAALVLAARARRLAADAVAEALRKDAVEQSQREETTQTADGDTVATLYQRARRLMHGQARIDGLIATIKAEQRKAKEGLHGKHARLDEDGYIIDFANFGTAYGREYQYIAKEKRYAPDTVISALQKFLATSGTLTNDQADIVGRAVSFLEDEDQDEAARIEADQAPAGESQEPEPADKPAPPKPSEPATPAPLSNQRNLPQKQPDDAPIGEVFGYGPGNGVVIFRGTRTAAKDVLATYKAMGAELMAGMREFTVWIRNPTDDTMQALQYDPPPESGAVGPGGPAWAPKSESPAPAAAPAPKPEPAPAPARAPAPAPEPAPKASPKASDMASMSDADMEALIDQAISDETAKPAKPPKGTAPAPAPARAPLALEPTTPEQLRAEAARRDAAKKKAEAEAKMRSPIKGTLQPGDLTADLFGPTEGPMPLFNGPQKPAGGSASGTRSASDILADAAKHGVKGIDDAVKGLFDLFGGGKRLGMLGSTIDEDSWAKAKPHFEAAYRNFVAAGKDLMEFIRWAVSNFGAGVKPYLVRFKNELPAPAPSKPIGRAAFPTNVGIVDSLDQYNAIARIFFQYRAAARGRKFEMPARRSVIHGDDAWAESNAFGSKLILDGLRVHVESDDIDTWNRAARSADARGAMIQTPKADAPAAPPAPPAPDAPDAPDAAPGGLPFDAELQALIESNANAQGKAARMQALAKQRGVSLKELQEAIEAQLVEMAHRLVLDERGEGATERQIFDKLIALYENQPILSARTSTSVEQQAYSTPMPLAFVSSFMLDLQNAESVYEPTAGNGMLTIGARREKVTVNEANPVRARALRQMGFKSASEYDAENIAPLASFDAIPQNPPFGTLKNSRNYDGYILKKVEHSIAVTALSRLNDNGASVMILGANMEPGHVGTGADRTFLNYLHNNFNVVDHFEVAGELYGRQGAKWPVRVVVIAGRKEAPLLVGDLAPKTVDRLSSWADIWSRAEGARNEIAQIRNGVVPAGGQPGPTGVAPQGGGPAARPPSVSVGAGGNSRSRGGRGGRGRAGNGGAPAAGSPNGGQNGSPGGQPQGSSAPPQPDTGAGAGGRPGNAGAGVPGLGDGSSDRPGPDAPAGSDGRSGNAEPGVVPGPAGGLIGRKVTDHQNEYIPASGSERLETLIPTNIAEGVAMALQRLRERVGNIDEWLAGKLHYDSVAAMHRGLAAEQVDGAALAIDQIERKAAVIIGDETGIGKGRQAAAVIRYAKTNGMVPVFLTKDPKLFTDIYRDLTDIDTTFNPFIIGDYQKATIVDEDNNKLFRPASNVPKRQATEDGIIKSGMADSRFDSVLVTYSQINKPNDQQRFLYNLVQKERVVLILDEAHDGSGEDSMQGAFLRGGTIKRKQKDGTWVTYNPPGILRGAAGAVYLSATYSKRPENMPLYFRTDLGKAAHDMDALVSAMQSGGVALQQAVANALAKAGQYIRRERDFTGVSFERRTVMQDREQEVIERVDAVTTIYRRIREFSEMVRDAVEGGALGSAISNNQTQTQIDYTEFASIAHNYVSQLLLGLKVPAVVEEAAAAFKRGEKPIISLMNTMEGALGEFADDRKVVSGRPITLTMKDLIRRALDRTLRAHDKSAKGDTETIYFTAADVGLQAIYDSIVADIKAMPEMAVPVSPIDALLHGLRGAGMTVGEMTGRTSGIEYDDVTYRSGMYQRRPKADKNKLVNDFNSGRLDAIILNASGSTGLSLHASTKFKDQRTRAMIVAQAHLDITVVMQTFGRIKRTGMVPGSAKYIMLVLPLEAERRPGMMLERKMKSLNANTTAETTGSVSLDVVDFFNKYGDTIVGRYLIDAGPELQRFTRLSPDIDPDTGEVARQEDMALKFTGRMALRPNHEQGEAYVAIVNSYSELIEYLKSTDQYDLEATTYEDWGGELLKDEILTVGTDESSIFTASTRMQQWRVKDTRPVPTSKQMQREFRDNMVSTEKAVANAAKIDTEIERLFKETIAEREREMKTARDPGMKHALDHAIAFYKAARVTWQNKTAPALAKCTAMAGVPIYLTEKDASNNVVGRSLGVIVNISAPRQRPGSIKSAASGFTLQVLTNQPGGRLRIPLSQFLSKRFDIERAFGVSFDDIDADVPKDNRFERWVLAGNPIRAIDASGGRGRIVSFRANDKSLVNGLLMAPSWTPGQLAHDPRLQLNGGAAVARVLDVAHFPLASRDAQLVPNRSSGYYDLSVPAGKSVGGDVYLDSGVRGLTGDFFKVGNRMKTRPLGTQEIAEVADAVAKITGRVWRVNLKPTDDIAKEVREANTYAAKKGQAGGGTSRFSVGGQTRFSVAGGAEQARNNPEEQARIRRLVDHAPVPVHDAGRSGILTAASMFRDLEKDFPAGDDRVEWKNADSGMQINVTRTALRHSIRSKFNPVKGAAHRVLRRLIESAVHLETYAPRSADDLFTIRSMHVFYAAVRVDGRIYGVRLKAKDYVRPERGIGHYDLVAVEIEKAAGVTDAAVVSDSGQSSSPAASSVNVSDLLRGVKLEDGRIALPETAFSALRPQGSVQAADVRKRIEKLAGRLAFKVKVVQSISEMDPADREDAERSARAQGIVSTPRGVFSPSGTVYLVADGMADAREAAEALLHETVERGMDAIQTDDLMDLVHRALAGELAGSKIVADAWGRVEANYPGLDRKTDAGRRAFAREVIAHIAENRKRLPGMWTKLVRAVRAFLAKLAVGTRLQGRFGSGSQAERLIERLIDVAIEAGRMAGADRATADGRRKTEDGAGPDVGSRGKGSVQGLEGRDPMDSVTQGIARAMGAEPQGGAARFSVGWPSRENPYRTVIRTVRDDGQTRVLAVQTMSDEETFFETWVRDETIPGGWDLMGVATRESEAGDYSIEQTRAHRRALTQDHLDYIRTQPWYIRAWHRLGPEKATQSIIKGGGKMVAEQVSAGYDMSPRYEVENGRRGFYIPSRSKAGYGFTFVPADTLEGPGAEAVAGAQEGFSGPERPGAKVIELKQDYRSRAQEFMDDSGFRTVEEFYDYVTDDRSNGTEFAASAAFHTLSAHFGENIISATDPKIVLQFIAEVLEEADRLRAESERAPTATVEKPGFAAEGRTAFSAAGDTRFSATAPDGWSPHNQKIKELSDQVEALRQERDAVASRTREEERAVADAKIADIEAQLAAAKAQLKGAKANPRSAVRVAALEAELAEARRGTTQAVRQERAGLASRIAELEARIKQAKKDAVRMVSAERGRQMDAAAATEGRLRDTERQLRKSDRAAERQEAEIARKEALIQQLMAVRDKIPETQQLLMDYMAETLDDEGKQPRLPKEVSRRVVGAIVSTSRGKTEERIEERFRKAVEKIDAESVAYWKGQFRVRIEAMLDKPATFELNSKLAGKRGSQFYRDRVNEAKRLVNLSPRAAADEMGTIIEDSRNASSEAESSGGIIGITDEQRARIIMAEKFGALFQRRDVTLEEMRAAMAELESIIGRGMMEWEEREQEFRAETDRRVSDTVNAATGNKGLMTKPEEAARWNNRTAWRKLLDRAQGWDTMHQSLEHLLDKLDLRKDQPGMGGSLQQTFVRPAHDAQSERDRLVREHYEDMAKGKERVYGLKGRALARRLAKNQEVKKSGIFLSTPKGPQEMQMSRNQAIYWWTVFRHAETLAGVDVDRWATMSTEERKNLPGDGQLLERLDAIGWTQETKEQMERFLAPEDLAWGRWLMDRYESEYADFAPVYERLMYVKPPKLAGYVPLRTEFYGKFEDTGIPEGGGPIPSIFFAWSKLRKANLRAIRVADADAVYVGHFLEMSHFRTHADLVRMMRAAVGDERVQEAVAKFHGPEARLALNGFVNKLTTGGEDTRSQLAIIDQFRIRMAKAVIPSPVTMLKQWSSFPAFAAYMPAGKWAQYVAEFMARPNQWREAVDLLRESEQFKSRYTEGWERDVRAAMRGRFVQGISKTRGLFEWMNRFVMWGDRAAVVIGGFPVYRYAMERARFAGKPEWEARAEGLREWERVAARTQQSGATMDLSAIQTGVVSRLFTMFMTQPMAYWRMYGAAWRAYARGKPGAKKQLLKVLTLQHVVLPALFTMVAEAFFAGDDDDDDEAMKTLMRNMALGPLQGIILAGQAAEFAVSKAQGQFTYGQFASRAMPYLAPVDDLANVVRRGWKMIEDGEITMYDALKVAEDMTSLAGTGMGVPLKPLARSVGGIYEAATGQTENPVLRGVGYSRAALGEEPLNRKPSASGRATAPRGVGLRSPLSGAGGLRGPLSGRSPLRDMAALRAAETN